MNNQQPKTGIELINSFFEQLSHNKEKYPCPEIIDCITKLHKEKRVTKTNIINALEEMRKKCKQIK